MSFQLPEAIEILETTPSVLKTWFGPLSDGWTRNPAKEGAWTPFDIVGHLIHGEKTDWMVRLRMVLEQGESATFPVYDRFAQFEESRGKNLIELLETFAELRAGNLAVLRDLGPAPEQMTLTGMHPSLGRVTLENLLATWVVHDLSHIAQAARVMSARYGEAVGPWNHEDYLRIFGE